GFCSTCVATATEPGLLLFALVHVGSHPMRLAAAACPKCNHQLGWGDLDGRFPCPGCGVALQSNYVGLLAFAISVMPLPFVLLVPLDRIWMILAGGALLMAPLLWCVARLLRVRLAREPEAT